MAQQKQTQLVSMRMRVGSLASLSGLRIWCCHKLWCRSQTWLGSGVAAAKASSYSFGLTSSLGTSICCRCGPKKKKKKGKNFYVKRECTPVLLNPGILELLLHLLFCLHVWKESNHHTTHSSHFLSNHHKLLTARDKIANFLKIYEI